MRHIFIALLLTLLIPSAAFSQDTRYVSDSIFIVLHKGPGNQYRWAAKLIPGTRLTASTVDGDWTAVSTDRGTKGWVRSEYLSADAPAQVKLPAAIKRAETLARKNTELNSALATVKAQQNTLIDKVSNTGSELDNVSQELAQLKTISGRSVQLDTDNRRLAEEAENLRSEVDTLQSENQRLEDKLKSEDFINGALAVLMGVFITLVVPRLWPKRRTSSSWA